MSHTIKLWERVIEARLRSEVDIYRKQSGFMLRKRTTETIFALKIHLEKNGESQKKLHLEKVYDRMQREEVWFG